jgi:NDP-sugar pyrophosphorylase family protein
MVSDTDAVDAIILAGGLGTRLRPAVSDLPKPLAPVNGKPFLDYQLELARVGGIRSVVLAAGHLAHKIEQHYADHPPPLPMKIVVELERLGTGGGVCNALSATFSARVLVLNGDSIFSWRLPLMARALASLGPLKSGVAMALVEVTDTSRFGNVEVEGDLVIAFREKGASLVGGLINAGAYLFDRQVLEALPRAASSLEHDLFPKLALERRIAAAPHTSAFLDIGLPESYALAADTLKDLQHL